MARYSAFLGRRVEVQYRAGEILLPASGTFVADSGRSIFLEQHFDQRGQAKQFRWEIPYQYIVRIHEGLTGATPPVAPPDRSAPTAGSVTVDDKRASVASAAAGDAGGSPALFPLSHRPKSV
jgi:hypothetical protein